MGADQHHDWNALALSTLDWWREAGVDTLVGDEPYDWLARRKSVAAPTLAEVIARPEAVLPATLDEFLTWRTGPEAPESGWSGGMTSPEGDPASTVMVVTDVAEGDGLLDGSAGTLFDRMLAAIGLSRDAVYLAPLAYARPLGGRIPPEMEARLGELARHHVSLAAPKSVLLLGQAVSRALLGTDATLEAPSLRAINLKEATITAVATLHPRYLLKQPAHKARAWKDLQLLKGGLR